MKRSKDRLDNIIAKLRQRKFRITPQRIAVLKVFLLSNDHPSVEQVHEQVRIDFPTTSLATVYKTVSLLKEVGEIFEIGFTDGRNRYDGKKPYPHAHLICTKCKTIIDPEVSSLDRLTVEVAQSSGYRILSHQLEFFGICPACQDQE
jgi:Fur family transcriptional regulator, peroxide stress response regulator